MNSAARTPAWLDTADVDPHHGQHLVFDGYTVLVSNPDGSIDGARQGLFDHDTRVLSHYRIRLGRASPRVDSTGLLTASRWMAHLAVPRPGGEPRGPALPQDMLELEVRNSRSTGPTRGRGTGFAGRSVPG